MKAAFIIPAVIGGLIFLVTLNLDRTMEKDNPALKNLTAL